jgi:hypothetical protein
MHVNIDLENGDSENDIALPYVITIEKGTGNILSIRRNWNPDDKLKAKRQHFVHYGYIPGFGFYCFGLIHLIGAFAKSGTMILRQLVDAGTLANLPGGLKSRGLRIKGDDTPIAPGEFRDVDVPSGAIRDNILPLPYKEPSQVLNQLMNQIIEEGRRFASAADMKVSDMSANSPVGTTLAILERTLKVMSAVQARIYYAMKQEFKLLKGIIRDYTPTEYSYEPEVGDRRAKQSDYDNVDVIPVSDPNAATMSQKVVQYQAVMQMAQANPQIYDQVELNKQMLEVLGVKNIGKLIPSADDQKPKLTAQAAEQLLQLNQKEAAQQQAQQQAQDPLIQMQQQELAIKQQEVQIKAQKSQADIELDKARLMLDKEKIDSQERIEGAKLGAKSAFDKDKLEADQNARGVEIGLKLSEKEQAQEQDTQLTEE